MDRSIGALRAGLRELNLADDTILWFNGDNGGLSGIKPTTVAHLRGYKNSVYEGGLRYRPSSNGPPKLYHASLLFRVARWIFFLH